MLTHFHLFAAHDEAIDQCKVDQEQCGSRPRIHGQGSADGEKATAEIERIARVGIRAGNGEHFLFMEEACGISTDEEADHADGGAEEDGARGGSCQPEDQDGQEIAEANTPTGEEIESSHECTPRRCFTAAKTASTERSRSEESVSLERP